MIADNAHDFPVRMYGCCVLPPLHRHYRPHLRGPTAVPFYGAIMQQIRIIWRFFFMLAPFLYCVFVTVSSHSLRKCFADQSWSVRNVCQVNCQVRGMTIASLPALAPGRNHHQSLIFNASLLTFGLFLSLSSVVAGRLQSKESDVKLD